MATTIEIVNRSEKALLRAKSVVTPMNMAWILPSIQAVMNEAHSIAMIRYFFGKHAKTLV